MVWKRELSFQGGRGGQSDAGVQREDCGGTSGDDLWRGGEPGGLVITLAGSC